MFLFDWIWSALTALGLYNKSAKIIFLGLDNSGKTTLLHMLLDNTIVQTSPSLAAPNINEITIGNVKFRTFDLGGHQTARVSWKDYYADADGVVYLIDGSDRDRFEESKEELESLLSQEELYNKPILILVNKCDLPNAAPEEEIRNIFGLQHTYGKDIRTPRTDIQPVELFMCSVIRRTFKEGFYWLAQFMK